MGVLSNSTLGRTTWVVSETQATDAGVERIPIVVVDLPPLMRDRSLWAMVVTQFLGAFNDNLFKQLMLLLAVPVAVAGVVEVANQHDAQGIATIVFSLPFVLFSGIAGYIADRNSKRL